MSVKEIINNHKLLEFIRFGIVGCIALVILYAVYYLLLSLLGHNVAYTIGYVVSFICNYLLTVAFTFKTKASKKNGLGFAFSHLINYLMQVGCLNLFIWIGLKETIAPIPVFAICVPTNFVLVSFFMMR